MFCSTCGSNIGNETNYCPVCGAKIAAPLPMEDSAFSTAGIQPAVHPKATMRSESNKAPNQPT